MTKIEIYRNFQKFWPKSKFFENFNKIEIFRNFHQNRNFSKFAKKSKWGRRLAFPLAGSTSHWCSLGKLPATRSWTVAIIAHACRSAVHTPSWLLLKKERSYGKVWLTADAPVEERVEEEKRTSNREEKGSDKTVSARSFTMLWPLWTKAGHPLCAGHGPMLVIVKPASTQNIVILHMAIGDLYIS